MQPLLKLIAIAVLLTSCGNNQTPTGHDQIGSPQDPPENTFIYKADSDEAEAMRRCLLYDDYHAASCSYEELPLLGAGEADPTVDDILNRLLVKENWMGDRFAAVLRKMPTDVLSLAKSVRAFVIDDAGFSRYQPRDSTIQIDASVFCLASDSTDPSPPDYRIARFEPLKLYFNRVRMVDGTVVGRRCQAKTEDEMILQVAHMLYHELGHAADFYPPYTLSQTFTIDYSADISPKLSSQLQPTDGGILEEVMQYVQTGDELSSEVKALTASDYADLLGESGLGFYNYANPVEHFAELVSYSKMQEHFKVAIGTNVYRKTPGSRIQNAQEFEKDPDFRVMWDITDSRYQDEVKKALGLISDSDVLRK